MSQFSPDQRKFYLYWKEQFRRGNTLPADKTYRFLYAYEAIAEAKNAAELDAAWTALCFAYRSDAGFAVYLADWIVDLRFLTSRLVVDDVLALHGESSVRLDVAMLTNSAPRWDDVVDTVMASDGVARVADFLADGYGDMATIVELGARVAPIAVRDSMFQGLPNRAELKRFMDLRDERPSIVASTEFRDPLVALVDTACRELDIILVVASRDRFVESGQAEVRVPIVRDVLLIRQCPPANTREGLEVTIRHTLDDDARMLLAVVLALSGTLPYVEGRVDAAKALRKPFEALASACGSKVTLAHFRHAFFTLGHGDRAVWQIEPDVEQPNDIRMNQVVARFSKGLQHALYGTNARREIIDVIVGGLSKRGGISKAVLVDALASGCGASSALLPTVSEKVVA